MYNARIGAHQAVYKYIEGVLNTYISQDLARRHDFLIRNQLQAVESLVRLYKAEAAQAAAQLDLLWSGRLFAFGADDRPVFDTRSDLPPVDARTWETPLLSMQNPARLQIQGQHRRTLYHAVRFEPWQWRIFITVPEQTVHRASRRIRNATILITAGCALLVSGLAVFISRRYIVGPLQRLRSAAAEIAAHKRVEAVAVESGDELGGLARDIEKMSDEIFYSQQELTRLNAELENRVALRTTELNERNADLNHEIKARAQMQEQIAEALELNETIVSTAPVGIMAYEESGRCILVNDSAAAAIGGTRGQMLAQNFRRIESWQQSGLLAGALKVLAYGQARRMEVHTRTTFSNEIWIDCHLARFLRSGRPHLLLTFEDISARKSIAAQLEERNRQLELSNRELDDFAYIASHDLREPLRGIANFSTFLLEDYAARIDPEGRNMLHTLTRLCRREENLIDSLLHYSRVGRTDLDFEAVDLNQIISEVKDLLVPSFGSDFEVSIPEPLPTLRCDRVRIHEVFANLIANGLKYNDSRTKRIEIGFDRVAPGNRSAHGSSELNGEPGTVFYVRDNGIGIRPKHQQKIFTIFKRLHGRDKYGGGTGAGLTIVKKIIERHGGSIRIDSRLGHGTTFYFGLPDR